MDLDLEAPGLHYKFQLGSDATSLPASLGIVDILAYFLKRGRLPSSLQDYAINLSTSEEKDNILLMPAGSAPSAEYWRSLSQVDWHDLLYGRSGEGALFFLELRELIKREFSPDICLIDARTGITDMGGIATTLLPDTVACLGLASPEHLEGLRAAMRGIHTTAAERGESVEILPVISRFLNKRNAGEEQQELERIRTFLGEPFKGQPGGLTFRDICVLHSEPTLDLQERLLIGGKNGPHELPLLRDYLRLFWLVFPEEDLRPHVAKLIERAVSHFLDDPDATQSDLEALTTYCADPEAHKALLKVYKIRKASLEKTMQTASVMWQLRPSLGSEKLLQEIVDVAYSEPRALDVQKRYVDMAEDVWRASPMHNARVGISIANAMGSEDRPRAIRLLWGYLEKAEIPDFALIARLVALLRANSSTSEALAIVNSFKGSADNPAFFAEWAKVIVEQGERRDAKATLADPFFRISAVRSDDPIATYRLLRLAGSDEAPILLSETLERALTPLDMITVRNIAQVYFEEGREADFVNLTRDRVPKSFLEELQLERYRTVRYSRQGVRYVSHP